MSTHEAHNSMARDRNKTTLEEIDQRVQRLIGAGQYDAAEQCYLDAIKEDPDRLGVWMLLGSFHLDRSDWIGAEEVFRSVIERDQGVNVHSGLAQALAGQCRFEEAVDAMREAVRLKATPSRWIMLGSYLSTLQRSGEAIECYNNALDEEPNNDEALYGLALELRGDDPRQAEMLLRKACKIEPKNSLNVRELGFAIYLQDRPADAIDYLQQAVEIDDEDPWAHYYLSLAYDRMGMTPKAETHLSRSRQLCPGEPLFNHPRGANK